MNKYYEMRLQNRLSNDQKDLTILVRKSHSIFPNIKRKAIEEILSYYVVDNDESINYDIDSIIRKIYPTLNSIKIKEIIAKKSIDYQILIYIIENESNWVLKLNAVYSIVWEGYIEIVEPLLEELLEDFTQNKITKESSKSIKPLIIKILFREDLYIDDDCNNIIYSSLKILSKIATKNDLHFFINYLETINNERMAQEFSEVFSCYECEIIEAFMNIGTKQALKELLDFSFSPIHEVIYKLIMVISRIDNEFSNLFLVICMFGAVGLNALDIKIVYSIMEKTRKILKQRGIIFTQDEILIGESIFHELLLDIENKDEKNDRYNRLKEISKEDIINFIFTLFMKMEKNGLQIFCNRYFYRIEELSQILFNSRIDKILKEVGFNKYLKITKKYSKKQNSDKLK